MKNTSFILVLLLIAGLAIYYFVCGNGEDESVVTSRSVNVDQPVNLEGPISPAPGQTEFAGSKVCIECHDKQQRLWSGSHHDWAMRDATTASVRGDFDNAVFENQGESWRFYKRGDQFIVNTTGSNGQPQEFIVKYTFGIEPLQQYLLELPRGRLQALTVAWDTRPISEGGQRWFHLRPEARVEWGDPLHWSGRGYNWNSQCAECHSTELNKNYNPQSDSYHTTWREINVSCEACHGPGSAHVDWARTKDRKNRKMEMNKGLVVDYRHHGSNYQVGTCAICHSRRHPVSAKPHQGSPFLDNFMPALLQAGLYYADGQKQGEVYVYGSYLQSKMYRHGVACTDCHDPHSARVRIKGNGLCLQCHQSSPPVKRFPTLKAKDYDTPSHHMHRIGSAGSQCVNCHMPVKTYMVVDSRRDHSFRIPRPELSEKLGVPNACNSCHQNKSFRWAKDAIEMRHGQRPAIDDTPALILAAARKGAGGSVPRLGKLVSNVQIPAIVRATALGTLPRFFPDPQAIDIVIGELKDKAPLMRATAAGRLDALPHLYRQSILAPLLNDPIQAVRIEAARLLAGVNPSSFGGRQGVFESALAEYRALQVSQSDTPEAQVNLAVMYTQQNLLHRAERAYKRAIKIAPGFIPARINLANLYNKMGRNKKAEAQLRKAIERAPGEGELFYSLGLILAEEGRLQEVAPVLEQAVKMLPDRARVAYNYALSLQHLDRYKEAETQYQHALDLAPRDPDIVYALITLYMQQQRWGKALPHARVLVDLLQGRAGSRELLDELRAKIQAKKNR